MNILRCLLILSALASLLVTGPNLFPVQSFAAVASEDDKDDNNKITKDYKDSIHKDIDSKSVKTNQHLGQDNLCYRDDGCEQANEGEQVEGKDNTASGFNDQSKSIQQQPSVSTPTTPGIPGNGTTPPHTPSTLTVTKDVECNFTSTTVDCPTANTFNITATTGNGSSISFNGYESGTPLTINPPFPASYQITETSPTQGFVVATIPVGVEPRGVAFNPDNGDMYVVNQGGNTVSVIDGATNTVVGTPIPVGSQPIDVAFNPDNGFMYVTNLDGNSVTVIDGATNTVVGSPIPVGSEPFGIAFNPDNGDLYVANFDDNNVSVINGATNTVVATIPVGNGPIDVAFNPDNGFMYVANYDGNTVTVIDGATNTVVGSPIPVGSHPIDVAFNPDNGDLYVANRGGNTVTVIDGATNTVVGTPIPVGTNPFDIAFNPNNGDLYVTNADDNTVTVIDGATNTVVGSPIPVGSAPIGIVFNPNNGFMYVANQDSNTVSVIAPLTTTFSEGCSGTVGSGGQTATCTVTNAYGRPA